jgi:hypothetical protein
MSEYYLQKDPNKRYQVYRRLFSIFNYEVVDIGKLPCNCECSSICPVRDALMVNAHNGWIK